MKDPNEIFYEPLTDAELRVFKLLIKAYSDSQIAEILKLSPHTVNTQKNSIYLKFIDDPNMPSSTKRMRIALRYYDII